MSALAVKHATKELSEKEKFRLISVEITQKPSGAEPTKIRRGNTSIGTLRRGTKELTIKISTDYDGADWIANNLDQLFDLVDENSQQ